MLGWRNWHRGQKADFENAKELTKDGEPGISAIRFKCGCVDVCRTVTSLPMTEARRAIFVEGKVLPLKFKKCIMRTDIIRLPNGAPDLRYRPEYHGWSVKLRINFNSEVLSAEDVVNLLSRAGQFEGVCEWRPGKSNSGTHGMFKVTSVRNSN